VEEAADVTPMTIADQPPPVISIVIPCRNEEGFIARCLDSLLANDYPRHRLDIIVADGLSRDRTRTITAQYAARHPHIRIVDNPDGTIPAAMNRGIQQSRGEIIMKVDAHSSYPPTYISECVRYLLTAPADMAGGVCSITPRNTTVTAEAIAAGLSHWFASGNAYVKTGSDGPRWADAAAFGCWKRETLEKLGPFDERLTGSSDMEFNMRLRKSGGRILLVPQITVSYYADGDLKSFWKHNFNDGIWATYTLKFGKQASSWRHWVPLGFVISLLVGTVATQFYASVGWVLVGMLGTYLLCCVVASAQWCVKYRNWKLAGLLPLVFAVRHIAHGLGALHGVMLALVPGSLWKGRRSPASSDRDVDYPGRRLLDIGCSLAALIGLSPLLFAIGLLIRLSSSGPILYRGVRLGKNEKPFNMLKFRTMYWETRESDPPITTTGDRRVTPVGAVLRKFKLDELPQLINVLRGEMSVVGPRPEAPFYFQFYTSEEKQQVLSVRPGMTDYGSLLFHDEGTILTGAADPVKAYLERIRDQKVKEQLRCIKERSFLLDIKIILMTVMTIVSTRFRSCPVVQSPVR
jgi:lipopolysaccharide/colanic/teichoic acid biosynthesis glycosyltransferase/GT2 family glycosyltransferase